jgi:HEAT repeat protein
MKAISYQLWWTVLQLKWGNPQTRYRAAEKLGEAKDLQAVEPLVAALQHADERVRIGACALGEIKDATRSDIHPPCLRLSKGFTVSAAKEARCWAS